MCWPLVLGITSSWLSLQCSYFINIFVCVNASNNSTDIGAVWLCLISCSSLLLTWITTDVFVYVSTRRVTLLSNCVYKLSHIRTHVENKLMFMRTTSIYWRNITHKYNLLYYLSSPLCLASSIIDKWTNPFANKFHFQINTVIFFSHYPLMSSFY